MRSKLSPYSSIAVLLLVPNSHKPTCFSCTFQWINDIENDPVYRSWPTGVQELLRATFPGVIRQIRRNFFNLVSPLKARNVEGLVVMKGMELRAVFIVVQFLFCLN